MKTFQVKAFDQRIFERHTIPAGASYDRIFVPVPGSIWLSAWESRVRTPATAGQALPRLPAAARQLIGTVPRNVNEAAAMVQALRQTDDGLQDNPDLAPVDDESLTYLIGPSGGDLNEVDVAGGLHTWRNVLLVPGAMPDLEPFQLEDKPIFPRYDLVVPDPQAFGDHVANRQAYLVRLINNTNTDRVVSLGIQFPALMTVEVTRLPLDRLNSILGNAIRAQHLQYQ